MSSPKASIVIPSFNSAAWLAHAVESARKQSVEDIEIVVVDDGSTDSTEKLMRFLCGQDKRIVYTKLDNNVGRSQARNIGNRNASSKHILVLDADDIAYPDRVRLSLEKLKRADFVHGSCEYIDAIGSKLGTHNADVLSKDRAISEGVNRIIHSTCAYTKELALALPYRGGELADLGLDDWAFQLEVITSGYKTDFIAAPIAAYRDIETGVSKTRDPKAVERAKGAFLEALKVTQC